MSNNTDSEYHLLRNEEHREALQLAVDKNTEEFLRRYGEEYIQQLNVIREVAQKLADNNIQAHIWALLPSEFGADRKKFWNFHNLSCFIRWENGKMTKESMLETSYNNHMIIMSMIDWFRKFIGARLNGTAEVFNGLYQYCLESSNWFQTGEPPAHIKDELNKL